VSRPPLFDKRQELSSGCGWNLAGITDDVELTPGAESPNFDMRKARLLTVSPLGQKGHAHTPFDCRTNRIVAVDFHRNGKFGR
jgi:hypothetical protein